MSATSPTTITKRAEMRIESSYDVRTSDEAWDYFVGSQTVTEWLDYDGPTTVEAIAVDYLDAGDGPGFLGSDDINERDRIARLLAEYIERHRAMPTRPETRP